MENPAETLQFLSQTFGELKQLEHRAADSTCKNTIRLTPIEDEIKTVVSDLHKPTAPIHAPAVQQQLSFDQPVPATRHIVEEKAHSTDQLEFNFEETGVSVLKEIRDGIFGIKFILSKIEKKLSEPTEIVHEKQKQLKNKCCLCGSKSVTARDTITKQYITKCTGCNSSETASTLKLSIKNWNSSNPI